MAENCAGITVAGDSTRGVVVGIPEAMGGSVVDNPFPSGTKNFYINGPAEKTGLTSEVSILPKDAPALIGPIRDTAVT
jgi:hypothetical protein